jgi:VanZ family protein
MSMQSVHQQSTETRAATVLSQRGKRGLVFVFVLLYVLLIIYGSLYPLSGWSDPHISMFSFLTEPTPLHISSADVLTNFVAYLPLGILLTVTFCLQWAAGSVLLATCLGGFLSFVMESVQTFLPSRTSSKVDLLVNILGTLAGALIGLAFRETSVIRVGLRQARDAWFEPGAATDVAICAAMVWVGSQLSPFVPSMDVSSIADGLRPLRLGLAIPGSLSPLRVASYALNIAGLGLLIAVVARQKRSARLVFLAAAGIVLCIKPLIVTRQLTLEALCGFALASIAVLIVPREKAIRTLVAMLCILAALLTAELSAGAGGGLHRFNWVPFAGELDDTVNGFGAILDNVWPFVTLAGLSILGFGRKRGPMIYLGIVMLGLVFALEWAQTGIEGRYGDVTTVLLAAAGWFVPWIYIFITQPAPAQTRHRSHHAQVRATS